MWLKTQSLGSAELRSAAHVLGCSFIVLSKGKIYKQDFLYPWNSEAALYRVGWPCSKSWERVGSVRHGLSLDPFWLDGAQTICNRTLGFNCALSSDLFVCFIHKSRMHRVQSLLIKLPREVTEPSFLKLLKLSLEQCAPEEVVGPAGITLRFCTLIAVTLWYHHLSLCCFGWPARRHPASRALCAAAASSPESTPVCSLWKPRAAAGWTSKKTLPC